MSLFKLYGDAAGQHVDPQMQILLRCFVIRKSKKSVIFGFAPDEFPFNYLGVPIFKGNSKAIYLRHIVDKLKVKLSS